jgi:hypothetical protein
MSAPAGYEAIKEMARHRRVNITDLLVMARQNDPFFAGSPAQLRDAEWFATWWNELGYQGRSGVHLRAVHYRLVSQDTPPAMPNGLPYTNTLECWGYLNQASRMARHLKLVDVEAFEDHRNPDPVIYAADPEEFEPTLEMDDWPEWQLPEIAVNLDGFKLPLPEFYATGYRYSPACQPYHRELWIEKSTMNEVLRPVCQRYNTNLVSSIGFQSIPSTIALLRRAEAYGKPARVFYISDFDPAGSFMPDAVARQIEYWRLRLGIDIEVKLEPIALTREQVIRYRLPSIPIKESDRRAAGFEARYGMLATELDALEALRPGALARLVSAAITPYYDRNLHDAWDEASVEADAVADSATKWVADGETLTEKPYRLESVTS